MKLIFALIPLALVIPAVSSACDCGKGLKPAATESPDSDKKAPRKFPLKGVVTDLLPDQSALMVKHEAIPGVMKAMTMMFVVDPSALTTVKKGDAITAVMYRDGDTWRLEEIKPVAPSS